MRNAWVIALLVSYISLVSLVSIPTGSRENHIVLPLSQSDRFRPLIAGVQMTIATENSSGEYYSLATTGFSSHIYINGKYFYGILTAAHCVRIENQVGPAQVYQPTLGNNNYIGEDWRVSNNMDAAWIATSPYGVEVDPFVYWYNDATKPVVGARHPKLYTYVTMIGITSGIIQNCEVFKINPDSTFKYNCSGRGPWSGDSGGPVIYVQDDGTVLATGIISFVEYIKTDDGIRIIAGGAVDVINAMNDLGVYLETW